MDLPTVEQRSILPTVWAHFFPCGISVPFFVSDGILLNIIIFTIILEA